MLEQFDKQRSRGTRGFGVFSYNRNKASIFRDETEDGILRWFTENNSPLIMFHHRFPTSTVNVAEAAHPLRTGKYFGKTEYVLVHNGIIYNDAELFAKHSELGIRYDTLLDDLSFNDSETLLWEFALTMEGKKDRMETRGDLAIVCAKLIDGKLDTIFFGRKGRPLHFYRNKKTVELSSEGRGDMIAENKLYTFDYKRSKLHTTTMSFTVPYTQQTYSYQDYDDPHYENSVQHGLPRVSPPCTTFGNIEYEEREDGLWYPKEEQKKPNQLEMILRERFPAQFGKAAVSSVLTDETLNEVDKDLLTDDQLFELEPSSLQIGQKTMLALNDCYGNFEGAYWLLEAEYESLLNTDETLNNIQHRLLLEAAMEQIERDPEYVNVASVSSKWRELCWTPA